MPQERRKFRRYRPVAQISACLRGEGASFFAEAHVGDLSEGGCCLIMTSTPQPGTALVVDLQLEQGGSSLGLTCHMTSYIAIGDAWQVSLAFSELSAESRALLQEVLATDFFLPIGPEAPSAHHKHWRVNQWAAYLTAQHLPVMARSKAALAALEAQEAQEDRTISCKDLADLAQSDPFLCLCLLREAEGRRSSRLGHETTTLLAAVMQIGEGGIRELLRSSPETDETVTGLAACEACAATAGRLAASWSTARADVSPDELVMAALLSEIGELLLWHFSPDLPQAALDALASGDARRSVESQELRCGFKFKDLTLKCAEVWHLPAIVVQLIHGTDNVRANIARICINTARHLAAGPDNPALPDDIADAKLLIPGASLSWLVSCLTEVPEELRPELLEKATAALERKQQVEEGASQRNKKEAH